MCRCGASLMGGSGCVAFISARGSTHHETRVWHWTPNHQSQKCGMLRRDLLRQVNALSLYYMLAMVFCIYDLAMSLSMSRVYKRTTHCTFTHCHSSSRKYTHECTPLYPTTYMRDHVTHINGYTIRLLFQTRGNTHIVNITHTILNSYTQLILTVILIQMCVVCIRTTFILRRAVVEWINVLYIVCRHVRWRERPPRSSGFSLISIILLGRRVCRLRRCRGRDAPKPVRYTARRGYSCDLLPCVPRNHPVKVSIVWCPYNALIVHLYSVPAE